MANDHIADDRKKVRLIDANELRIQFDDIPPYIGLAGSLVQQYIDKAPTVDAVEVIRCESCKWYEPECENCDFWGGYRNPDHYCGEGERKNEAG